MWKGKSTLLFLISVIIRSDESSNVIHGILNLGTSNEWHAKEILAVLDDDLIVTLTRYAQSNVLSALLNSPTGTS